MTGKGQGRRTGYATPSEPLWQNLELRPISRVYSWAIPMGADVSRGYITAPLLIETLRPLANAVAEHYVKVIGLA